MNRKAKFAYSQMVLGAIVFSIGFILLLNFNLTEWYTKEKTSYLTNNFTQLTLMLSNYKSQNKFSDPHYVNELEIDSHLKWYCLSKNSLRRKQRLADGEHASSLLIVDNLNESIETKFHYLIKLFSFLICSSDTIYLIFIISCIIVGCIACCCGCFRFYIYEIKVNAVSEMKSSKESESNIYECDDNQAPSSPTKLNSNCCFSNSNKSKKRKKSEVKFFKENGNKSSIENKKRKKNSSDSFEYVNPNEYVASKAEITCPYDYDDLPKFIYETLNESSSAKLPRPPKSSPPPLLRNNLFLSTGKLTSDKYELVPFNPSDRLIRKQDNNTNNAQTFTEYFV